MSKISVIIPTFNSANYISETIGSILNQTFQDYEIIIVDDGSTDNTKQVLDNYASKIRYFFQINKGPSAARNKGIKEAGGEYIVFLDADDVWLKNYLDKCVCYLKDENCDLVMTDNYADIYSDDNKFLRREYRNRENYIGNENRLFQILYQRFQKGFSGEIRSVIKKSCFDRIGYFDENIKVAEDWDLWLRIAKNGLKVGYIQEPLFIYRRHPNALCRNKNKNKLILKNVYYAFKKNRKDAFRINRSLIKSYGQTLWMLGSQSIIKNTDIPFGIKCLLESQIYYFDFKHILNLTKKLLFKLSIKNDKRCNPNL